MLLSHFVVFLRTIEAFQPYSDAVRQGAGFYFCPMFIIRISFILFLYNSIYDSIKMGNTKEKYLSGYFLNCQDNAACLIGHVRSSARWIFDGTVAAAAGKYNTADGRTEKEI